MAKLLIHECLHTSLLELAHAAGHIAIMLRIWGSAVLKTGSL